MHSQTRKPWGREWIVRSPHTHYFFNYIFLCDTLTSKSKGCSVVRALASNQYGRGSNPCLNAVCGLVCSWFFPLLRDVSFHALQFLSLLKNQHFQISFRRSESLR